MGYLESLRGSIGSALIPLAYSTALVRDENGRMLFQRRSDFGVWGLPGGILEFGESPADCAMREAHEETGLSVRPLRLTSVLSSPRHNILYPNGDRVQQITFYFECSIEGGSLHTGGRESSALAFFPPDDFPPTLAWYRLALEKRDTLEPFFDPPEFSSPRPGSSESSTWSALRDRVGSAPLILPGATALIRDPHGRVLLVRRMDSGLWSLPGGLLELGESLAGTVMRETEEETGLQVEPIRIRGVFGGHRVVFPGGDVLFPIATWFECGICSGTQRPDGDEISRTEFFETSNLPEMIPGVKERLQTVLDSPGSAVFH
jgi:ADP-ribose pyrophosphatase YjhB (NUDIX family)